MSVPRAMSKLTESELNAPERAELSRLVLGAQAEGADLVLADDPDAVPATPHERVRTLFTKRQVEMLCAMGPAPPGPRPHPRPHDDAIARLYGARLSVDEVRQLAAIVIGSNTAGQR
jgi:hypothetical protein